MRSSIDLHARHRPRIGITMGDPAGVGAEIIVKALTHHEVYESCRPLVIGDAARLRQVTGILRLAIEIKSISDAADAVYQPDQIDCLDLALVQPDLPFGAVSAAAGEAGFRYVESAAALALVGAIDAICTAPLSKEAMHAAGHRFPGHTELLAHLTGTPEVSMMLVAPGLRVVHVTTHLGLIDAIERIEPPLVERTIERGHAALVAAGFEHQRIGVCGINPHAGENGLFGRGEEEQKIRPPSKTAGSGD
jgi:4-phospho-D-threonate 3-dehydrogenase / 4-phospho-D-erythronate 3-dehydrogenase